MNKSTLWLFFSGAVSLTTGILLSYWVFSQLLTTKLYFLPRADPLAKDTVMIIFSELISISLIFHGLGQILLSRKND